MVKCSSRLHSASSNAGIRVGRNQIIFVKNARGRAFDAQLLVICNGRQAQIINAWIEEQALDEWRAFAAGGSGRPYANGVNVPSRIFFVLRILFHALISIPSSAVVSTTG